MDKKYIYIIAGSLASGKTQIAKLLFPYLDYISPDQFTPIGKWTKQKSDIAWDKTHAMIEKKIKQGKNFVLDTAQARRINRIKLTKFIHQKSSGKYIIALVHVKSPLKDCLERNSKRGKHKEKEQQVKNYFDIIKRNPYTKKDGYDFITIIDNSIRKDEGEKAVIDEEEWRKKWYHTN